MPRRAATGAASLPNGTSSDSDLRRRRGLAVCSWRERRLFSDGLIIIIIRERES